MDKFFAFMLAASLSVACSEVGFRHPQPQLATALSSFPDELQASYAYRRDTLVFYPNRYTFRAELIRHSAYLSDSVILKQQDDFYFLNLRNEAGHWNLALLKLRDNALALAILDTEAPTDISWWTRFAQLQQPTDAFILIDTLTTSWASLAQQLPESDWLILRKLNSQH